MSPRTPKSRNSALKALRLKLAGFEKDRAASKKNTWWFVAELELQDEGSQLVAAPTANEAEAIVRKSWGIARDESERTELVVAPADDLDVIEMWLRSDDEPQPQPKLPVLSPTWPYVLAFAIRMEAKLEKNRHKGDREGWIKDDPEDLISRLKQELVDLETEVEHRIEPGVVGVGSVESIAGEAADVANFAMMIADVCGGVKP